jgi:pantoate--beta-alanine ligase
VRTIVIERVNELRQRLDAVRGNGGTVGFVPTMGAFHEGHRSLMREARANHEVVVVSLFVNPLQFGPNEDLDHYPRDRAGDLAIASEEGVDILFAPTVAEVYPQYPPLTTVHVDAIGDGLCGEGRPGHFDGVATVVAKLFAIVGPATAYFGRKDAQQLALVRRMAADLCFPVEVVGCPLVREADGLAMSSRNLNLSAEDRRAATVISRGLRSGADLVMDGERDAARLRRVVANILTNEPRLRLEYAEVVDAATLQPLETVDGDVLVAVAARVGDVRLIDNMTVHVDPAGVIVDLGTTVHPGDTPYPKTPEEAKCAAG